MTADLTILALSVREGAMHPHRRFVINDIVRSRTDTNQGDTQMSKFVVVDYSGGVIAAFGS